MLLFRFASRTKILRFSSACLQTLLWTAVLLLAARLPAQTAPVTTSNGEVIVDAQSFWNLSDVEKQKLHHVRFEILVYYYDPLWQLVWGECGGASSFLPVRGEPLPIKPGQLVRIEGVITPSRGILRNEVTVTVLKENVMPAPQPTKGRLTESDKLDGQWATVEGYVCLQREVDKNHIEYDVLSEGWLVTIRMLVKADEPVAQLLNTRSRFNGVYVSARDASRKLQRIDFWVPRSIDVSLLGEVSQDRRFQLPRTPLDLLPAAKRLEWVRIEGEVKDFKPGRSLTLRDDTGQITIETPQPGFLKPGDHVEVIGLPTGSGLTETLNEPYFLSLKSRSTRDLKSGAGTPPHINLRVVEQIMELPLSEVARSYRVTLRGTVIWSDPHVNFFFFQDATGGICVQRDESLNPPSINYSFEVKGITKPGRFAPEVQALELRPLSPIAVPAAKLVTLEQTMTGVEEAHWVRLHGYVRQVASENNWSRLDLTTSTGEFSAYVPLNQTLGDLTGAMVRITGVCSAEANKLRQLTGIRLWVSGKDDIEVEEAPLLDPFTAPRQVIAGLNQFTGGTTLNKRVTVKGILLLQVPGRYLVLQDGDSGLMVLSRESKTLPLGSAVEVSGFPGREGSRLVLREAVTRISSGGGLIQPLPCVNLGEFKTELDAHLVRLRGILNDAVEQPSRVRLTLQGDGVIFDAWLENNAAWPSPALGSVLELTGVYLLEFDEYHQPRGFRLQLRRPEDVQVISSPTWWTAGRALVVAGGLGLCTFLGIIWVVQLRRLVRAQTMQIRAQMDQEARMQAELERSSRLDSLGVLAGGIAHDFNNLLTAIMGNLGLMRMEKEAMQTVGPMVSEAERATKRASEITQQLLTFAKGGDPIRTAVDLPEVVKEAAEFVRHGSNVKVEFHIEPELPPANADASQISRVIHNIVLNAVQAMPSGGCVQIALNAVTLTDTDISTLVAGPYLKLTISDNGTGIPPDRLSRIFDPYFSTKAKGNGLGLASAHSIVKKHKGHITVESSPGKGATFCIWLPAENTLKVINTAPVASTASGPSAKVLFMDDEEAICIVARSILRRAGHQITVVNDGAAAIEAFKLAHASGQSFDIVILDLTVPGGMGGRDAAVELRRIDPKVRIIASSGYSQDPVMANHETFGFSAVLTKPYDPEAFTQTIQQVRQKKI